MEWDKKKSLSVIRFLGSKLSPKIEDIYLTITLCEYLQDMILDRYVLNNNSGPIFLAALIYYVYSLLEDNPYHMGNGMIHLLNRKYTCSYTLLDWRNYIFILIDDQDITYDVIYSMLDKMSVNKSG
jgi:hypothetical protein